MESEVVSENDFRVMEVKLLDSLFIYGFNCLLESLKFCFYAFPDMVFTVCFHHGGYFVRDWIICYKGGTETVVEGVDTDKWSYFEVVGLLKDLGIEHGYRMWWKVDEDVRFRNIRVDADAIEIGNYGENKKCVVHIYVEHDVDEGLGLVDQPHVVDVFVNESETDSDYVYSSEDEAKGVHFNDSEDERALALDDEFGIDDPTPQEVGNEHVKNRVAKRGERAQNRDSSDEGDNMEKEYATDELNSSDLDESDGEKGPKYEMFRVEQLNKDYEFKVGMEFKSLEQFKDAIIEWSVLNGREIKFKKNDAIRVRVECKRKCGFLALCSQVGGQHTFRMKRWIGEHTCARVLNNKSAKSKWVAKAVASKMTSSTDYKILDIMTDLRKNHSIGITFGRAWRAKQKAKRMIEGDAAKQYTLIWRYAAELRRANPGNTCKINVLRPTPTIEPRFGSFYFCLDGCKKGFMTACRPFIGVDGCHLKTKYGGQLLIAVGRDPNDQYMPLAFGVVENETKEAWRWFLTLLLEDIGKDKRWAFISNLQKVSN